VVDKNILLLGLIGLGLYIYKGESTTINTPQDSSSSGATPTSLSSQEIVPKDDPYYSLQPSKTTQNSTAKIYYHSSTSTREITPAIMNQIDYTAKSNPTKTLYYKDYGIVTTGGLGYSTAYPEAYAKKNPPIITQNKKPNPYNLMGVK
jgi:hypothetical protein